MLTRDLRYLLALSVERRFARAGFALMDLAAKAMIVADSGRVWREGGHRLIPGAIRSAAAR